MTVEDYLKSAAKAVGNMTDGVQAFAECYCAAVETHGEAAEEAFRLAYPTFGEREWRRMLLIGKGSLMPCFLFKSDAFVAKLLRLKDSMKWQKKLTKVVGRYDRQEEIKGLMRKINRTVRLVHTRTTRDILLDIVKELVRYSSLRDDEWEFEENHGDRSFWDSDVYAEHDELLGDIQNSRNRLTELAREATGDDKIRV